MKIKKQLMVAVAILLFSFSFVFAAVTPSQYPTIAGITISSQTTAAEYIIYFFDLAVAVGGLIAVVVVIMAGIDFLTSSGNPGKLEDAKGRLKNAGLGIAILLGAYLILGIINPQLQNVKVNSLICNQGIQVSASDGETVCITDTTPNIAYDIKSTLKWFVGADTLYKVYIYSGSNFTGTVTDVALGSGDISGAKSIYFIKRQSGFYLFNGTNYQVGSQPTPFYVPGTIDLNASNGTFDNLTKSMDIVNPSEMIKEHAVVFSDPKERGTCSFVGGQPVPDMGTADGPYYPSPIGNNTLSSMVVFKEDLSDTSYRGSVYLYNVQNCGATSQGGGGGSGGASTEQLKSCEIRIPDTPPSPTAIAAACSKVGWNDDGDRVLSFKITGSVGLVLVSTDNKCQYWDINSISNGTCFSSVIGQDVLPQIDGPIKPATFMVFPIDKK